jgi:hypothetical protein
LELLGHRPTASEVWIKDDHRSSYFTLCELENRPFLIGKSSVLSSIYMDINGPFSNIFNGKLLNIQMMRLLDEDNAKKI